ncbi:ATP-dependent helicase [candidate division WOR-3 bacterium]|nr:ATP-dependent helicase [candidate division WOR-3 bacterium]
MLRHPDTLPAAFVTLTHLPEQMRQELGTVLPWLRGHVVKSGRPYDLAKARGSGGSDPDVVFLPYSKLAGWAGALAGKVRTVIFDEVQELRRDGTNKYAAAGQLADGAEYVMGLTATPVYNYGGEMFNVMSVIAPDALGTRGEFIREWGGDITTSGQIKVREPGSLGHYLTEQGLMLGRTRKQVGRELPPVTHIAQTVQADADTIDSAMGEITDLAELLLNPDTAGKQRFLAAGEIDYKLRHATGVAKAPFTAEFVKLLLDSEDKVVVYVWHRDVYATLMNRLRDYNPVMFSGSESPTQKQKAKDAFLRPNNLGGSRVMLMSLRAGAGLDGLQGVCSCVVFAELDWSPGIHIQAVGRVARDGQESPVAAYFLHAEDGSDPAVMEVLNVKSMQAEPMVRPTQDVKPTPTEVDGDRARRLAAAALARAGRELPVAPSGDTAPDLAELFAEVKQTAERQPGAGQMGLFE